MPSVGRNIVANFVGNATLAVLAIVFPPIVARLLGIESYGLIGIYASLSAGIAVLDLGLTATLTREMARLSDAGTEDANRAMKDMVRTFELVFWGVGLCAGGAVFLAAPLVSAYWVHAQALPPAVITSNVRLIGLLLALQWPWGMYNGGLLGLQRQVSANVIQAVSTALRLGGGAAVVWKLSQTPHAFFLWQACIAGAQTIVTAVTLSRHLPRTRAPGAFRRSVLVANWRFSTGMAVTMLLVLLLTQSDKIVVSKLFPLKEFGYYTLAWTVGNGLGMLVGPVFVAVFPRLTQLVRQDSVPELTRLYHASCQIVSVAVLPAAAVLALFSGEVIWAWTGDRATVAALQWVVIPICIGTALNGLINIPYALQLAFGWTRLAIWANAIGVVVIIPLTVLMSRRYGTVGAASGWLLLNAGYVIFMLHAMHKRLLKDEQRAWYTVDVGLPLCGALVGALSIRALFASPAGRGGCLVLVAVAAVASVGCAGLASPFVRSHGRERLGPIWRALRA
jgi:O-antigen/teichoic acid export membrane protein